MLKLPCVRDIRSGFGLVLLVLILLMAKAGAAERIQHRLIFATSPQAAVDEAEVDDVLKRINTLIRGSRYGNPWDFPCPVVEFVRWGPVLRDARLPDSGTYEALASALKEIAPKANIYVVRGVECNGYESASGCDRIGSEPLIVGTYPGFDEQLWLHERGHSLGLRHSGESPKLDSEVPSNVALRFMFWTLGEGHVGKTSDECSAFMKAGFPSVVKVQVPAAPLTARIGAGESAPVMSLGLDSISELTQATAQETASTHSRYGLTEAAFAVVGPPWVHGAPVAVIKALGVADINSIRTMLRTGEVNPYWPQALHVLALAGDKSDVLLIKDVMEKPASAPVAGTSPMQKEARRSFLRTKMTAPVALGILANRLKSSRAIEILKNAADPEKALAAVDTTSAEEFSKRALHGLALAGTAESREFLSNLQGGGAAKRQPRLTATEIFNLRSKALTVETQGLDAGLRLRERR